jgi:hypothetical protein
MLVLFGFRQGSRGRRHEQSMPDWLPRNFPTPTLLYLTCFNAEALFLRCDGVTACDKKTAKKPFARTPIEKLPGFVVTPRHTVTRGC